MFFGRVSIGPTFGKRNVLNGHWIQHDEKVPDIHPRLSNIPAGAVRQL